MSIAIQAQEPVNYKQKFKSAVDVLDSCQECAVQQLLEIKAAQYAPEAVRINSTIVLANVSVSTGDIESLDVFLKDIEQYIAQHPDDKNVSSTLERLKGYRSELGKQQESFRDRLVGTWVTAETKLFYKEGTPATVIEIKKNNDGQFSAISFNYYDKNSTPKETNNIDIDGTHKTIGIHFGVEKVKEANIAYAQSLMNSVRINAMASAEVKARTGYSDWGKDFSNIFLTVMAKKTSIAKSSYAVTDYFLNELTPDILRGKVYYESGEERSDGKKYKDQYVREFYLYRLTPNDSIIFATDKGYWIVRLNDHFDDFKTIKKNLPKGKKLSLAEYNLETYSKLRNKVMNLVTNLEKPDAEWITGELEYGPKGYAWNDGYYYANERDAMNGNFSYDEKLKGPYKHKDPFLRIRAGFSWVVLWDAWVYTIHDYWKGFKREDNYRDSFDYTKEFYGSGIPKYFKMVDIGSKNK